MSSGRGRHAARARLPFGALAVVLAVAVAVAAIVAVRLGAFESEDGATARPSANASSAKPRS